MNKAILLGRLTADPELRYSQSAESVAIARFTVAINRKYKKDEADFINCVAFSKTAENISTYFKKGQMIAVEGSIQTNSWDDKETGQKRYKTEVIIENFYFVEKKSSNEANEAPNEHYEQMAESYTNKTATQTSLPKEDEDEDYMPF
jgi:single-strand DNA-binding protein